MADEPAPPSVASHTSILNNILNALMHLAGISPSGGALVEAAVRAAQTEMAKWNPPPDPAHPETEADGDGPPDDGSQPVDPEHPPAG